MQSLMRTEVSTDNTKTPDHIHRCQERNHLWGEEKISQYEINLFCEQYIKQLIYMFLICLTTWWHENIQHVYLNKILYYQMKTTLKIVFVIRVFLVFPFIKNTQTQNCESQKCVIHGNMTRFITKRCPKKITKHSNVNFALGSWNLSS